MLSDIQKRLNEHFLSLGRERAGSHYPVYALEHGLDISQIATIRSELARELVREGTLSPSHWLLWIVIAAEVGYEYDGDEYWNSFGERMPEWKEFGDREKIRDWYVLFHKKFQGFKPVGKFAKHFSIIAWPISHAILPRDLQGQFARHLYDLRYELARRSSSSEEIGKNIHSGDWAVSSRFHHFLEQRELAACLVLALRDADVTDTIQAIYAPTLKRIVADLEQRQAARDWLSEARTVLRNARLKASGTLVHRDSVVPTVRTEAIQEGAASLRLMAKQTTDGQWCLGVKLPDLGKLVKQTGMDQALLSQTRVRLTDRPDYWMPGRSILTLSKSEQRLKSLSTVSGSLLAFENDILGLTDVIADVVKVKGASPWLLRVQEDGVARQVIGNHVRTGQSYLIVSDTGLPTEIIRDINLRQALCDAEGLTLYFLVMPKTVGTNEIRALEAIKFGYALRVNIEPVGLVPRWDGVNGRSVWLTTEELILRLSADHPVREYSVTLDKGQAQRISSNNKSEIFLTLGHLPVGHHVIEVSAFTLGPQSHWLEQETLNIEVRTPTPWQQAIRKTAGFRVLKTPTDAGIDSIVHGKANIAVMAPPERTVSVDVSFFDFSGQSVESVPIGKLSVGDSNGLSKSFAKLGKETLAEKISVSPRVDLVFSLEELGREALSFPVKVRPYRWRLESHGNQHRVRLIDESGAETPPSVKLYGIAHPDHRHDLEYGTCVNGFSIEAPGALLVAATDDEMFTAVVSVSQQKTLTALSDLGASIDLDDATETPDHIPRLITLYRLWSRARQVLGPLGTVRKLNVCAALEQRIASILCGKQWADKAWENFGTPSPAIDQLQRDIGASPGFGVRLKSGLFNPDDDAISVARDFSRLAKTYRVCDDENLSTLALRIALMPASAKSTAPDRGVADWTRLAQNHALARGAYFARLIAETAKFAQPQNGTV